MARKTKAKDATPEPVEIAVGSVVLVYRGTDREQRGTVVEDFGDVAGQPVDVAEQHFADAARRWAVSLDNGELVFVNSESLSPVDGDTDSNTGSDTDSDT